jgi:tetratricopeptide (TPR) repeat protein
VDNASTARSVASYRNAEFGPDHPETLVAEFNLARELRRTGQFEAAQNVFEALVGKQRAIFGEDDWYVVSTEHSLGELLYVSGDLESAKRLQQHVLELSVRLFGHDSEQGQLSRINLANTLRELKEFQAEKPLREAIVDYAVRFEDAGSLHVSATKSDLAAVLRNLRDFKAAYAIDVEALAEQTNLGAEPRTIIWTKLSLAKDLGGMRKRKASADMSLEAFREAERELTEDDAIRTGLEPLRGDLEKWERRRQRSYRGTPM